MRKFVFSLPLLVAFSSFVSACGVHADEVVTPSSSFIGLGFFGGILTSLAGIALILSIAVFFRRSRE